MGLYEDLFLFRERKRVQVNNSIGAHFYLGLQSPAEEVKCAICNYTSDDPNEFDYAANGIIVCKWKKTCRRKAEKEVKSK